MALTRYFCLLFPLLLIAAPSAAQDGGAASSPGSEVVLVGEFGTVDLVVRDAELSGLLEMLSVQSHRNIIAGKGVSGTVSANLYDVTFNEALDAILRVNGYGWMEEGNFIYVLTQEELAAIQVADRSLQTSVFELQYIPADDAKTFIEPLLSADGKAVAQGTVDAGYEPSESDGGADSWAWSPMLVVSDYPEHLKRIADLLRDLDSAPRQVVVEATIVSTTVTEANEFGVDFSALSNIDIGGITGGPLAAAENLVDGSLGTNDSSAFTSSVGRTETGGLSSKATDGLLKVGVIRDHVGAFLKVLDQVTDTTVIARPRITCINRQRAEVLVGKRVAYLSTTQNQNTTTQKVEFLDTGVRLAMRPFISPDDMIRLELYPRLSSVEFREDGGQQIPDEITHEVRTNVRCRDGETVILGGLFQEHTSIGRRQVPVLGEIPLLGAAFRGQDDTVIKDEIIFLLTPTIISDERLWEAGRDSLVMTDAIREGARAGLLPFSREQVTANYNRDALDAYRRGDLDKALYWINLSLRTATLQPEMIRLRDRITDETQSDWERDLVRLLLLSEADRYPASPLATETGR